MGESWYSIESFISDGYTREQAEHLNRLARASQSMIMKKREPCTQSTLEYYINKANELSDELDYYLDKYLEENHKGYEE
jgi:hypothetical protein